MMIATETKQIVSFNIGQEEFAIHINFIQEIIKVPDITYVPLTKNYLEGVINIRGSIIPVINVRRKMNFENKSFTRSTRIIVTSHENRKVGLLVDNMNQVIRANEDEISLPPLRSDEGSDMFVESVYISGEKIITILDINALLDTK